MDFPKLYIRRDFLIVDGHPVYPDKSGKFFSIWNLWPHLVGRSIVVGFVGGRGSGKTANAVRMLINDYLLKGRRVWSRLPIGIDVVTPSGGIIPLRNIEIKQDFKFSQCHNGVIFYDEVNEEGADAYRSMTNEALELSYSLQELRKGGNAGLSKMDLIWTTQSEMFAMTRLRSQTDIIIKCYDVSITNRRVGMGEYTRFELWDYSGILKGDGNTSKMPQSPVLYNKPWWHCYNTGVKQREAIQEQKAEDKDHLMQIAAEMAEYVRNGAEEGTDKLYLWKKWGITEHRTRIQLGQLLCEQFSCVPNYNSRRYKYDEELAAI